MKLVALNAQASAINLEPKQKIQKVFGVMHQDSLVFVVQSYSYIQVCEVYSFT